MPRYSNFNTLEQDLLTSVNKQALINLKSMRFSSMCYNLGSEDFPFTNPNPEPLPNDDTTIRNALQAGQTTPAWCRCFCPKPDPSRINELKAKVNIHNLHILLKQMKQHASSSTITYDGGITKQDALISYYTGLKGQIKEYMQAIHNYNPNLLTTESFKHGGEFTANLQATLEQIQALAQDDEYSL